MWKNLLRHHMTRRSFEHLIPIELDFQCENASIMVIDDEPIMTAFVNRCLRMAGFETICCVNDPTQAISEIRNVRPDLILLDIVMPGLNGLELLKSIRSDNGLAETTVLMLSAADKKSKYQALNLGAVDFINKPVDGEDLEIRVRKALRII